MKREGNDATVSPCQIYDTSMLALFFRKAPTSMCHPTVLGQSSSELGFCASAVARSSRILAFSHSIHALTPGIPSSIMTYNVWRCLPLRILVPNWLHRQMPVLVLCCKIPKHGSSAPARFHPQLHRTGLCMEIQRMEAVAVFEPAEMARVCVCRSCPEGKSVGVEHIAFRFLLHALQLCSGAYATSQKWHGQQG